jgi:small subunit ribosomal protein S7
MSRRKYKNKKQLIPDGRYRNVLISKFINYIMLHGKKSIAENIFYSSIKKLFYMVNKYSIEVFYKVIFILKPSVEVKSKRVGGARYQVPVKTNSTRSLVLSLRWLISSSKSRKTENQISNKIACELFDIYNKEGIAYKTKINALKMAEANKAFAHYRW